MTDPQIRSTGFRTELRILELGGSLIEDRGTHWVIRTPDNPAYHWGNFLLLRDLPVPGGEREVIGAFHTEFPEARHVSIGIDGTEDRSGDVAGFVEAGLTFSGATVLSGSSLTAPEHQVEGVEVRAIEGDDDWEQRVQLDLVVDDKTPNDHLPAFVRARIASWRKLVGAGHAQWFGAFEEGRLLATCGIVRTADGEARYQHVATHPHARRRGLASAVVHHAGTHALTSMGADRVVIVAESDGPAIRLYRALGLEGEEHQTELGRTP
jgi:ribosomal protein S18 acetylase RimI-like enzyme